SFLQNVFYEDGWIAGSRPGNDGGSVPRQSIKLATTRNGAMRCAYCALRNRVLRQFPPSHSGARAQRGSPESITTVRDYGFRARAFGAPRNDGAAQPVQTLNSRP